jgi:phosphate transport system substrate-binding protein
MKFITFLATCFCLICSNSFAIDLSFTSKSAKRGYIYIVGSSTISPFMAAISEEFSRSKALSDKPIQTPIVESTGTIGGFKLFCEGYGFKHPDFVNASRMMNDQEIEKCYKNGVRDILEIKLGYDGIVIARAKNNGKNINNFDLTKEQIFLALAEKIYDQKLEKMVKNPYKFWDEINPKFPHQEILFFGPPASSGTKDVFIDMVMEDFCINNEKISKLFKTHEEMKKQCHKIREDGIFISSGENDDNILRSLSGNIQAFGIFGFNYLVVNGDKIQSIAIDSIHPSQETISAKKYSLSRPLFVYFKKENLSTINEAREFIFEIINKETIGQNGYLKHSGLVPLSDYELMQLHKKILPQIKK